MRRVWPTALAIVAVTVLVTGPTFAQTSGSGSSTPGSGTTTSPQPPPSPAKPGTPVPSMGSDPSKAGTPQTGAGKAPAGQVGAGGGTAGSKPSGTTNGVAGSEQVKNVQKALQEKGKDPGPIDGLMGPRTQAALRDFQKDQKLPETGRADTQTLEKLGVSR